MTRRWSCIVVAILLDLLALAASARLSARGCCVESGDERADYSYAFAFLRVLAAPALLFLFFSALLFSFSFSSHRCHGRAYSSGCP